jgi:hypothetical protein
MTENVNVMEDLMVRSGENGQVGSTAFKTMTALLDGCQVVEDDTEDLAHEEATIAVQRTIYRVKDNYFEFMYHVRTPFATEAEELKYTFNFMGTI